MTSFSLLIALPFFVLFATLSLSMEYGRSFEGDGTYYGETEGGHCSLRLPRPNMYSQWQPVALNSAQYGDSLPCGACIEYSGSGKGSGANPIVGTKIGYIMDECPSCAPGDIDLSKSGDGRWHVSWKFIPCPGSGSVDFLLEGSNDFYKKVQPRGTKSPVTGMTINGVSGTRTIDNFFEFHAQFPGSGTAVMKTVLGETVTVNIPYWVSDGVIVGGGTSSSGGRSAGRSKSSGGGKGKGRGGRSKPRAPKRKPKPAPPRRGGKRCVPRWRACGGRKARRKFRTTKCCGRWRCGWPRTKRGGYRGKRCLPPKKKRRSRKGRGGKCVPQWKPCTGPNNVWGTSRCCGKNRCVVAGERTFLGKRCEPK